MVEPPAAPDPGNAVPVSWRPYEDLEFLRSIDARTLRVLGELLEPQYRLEKKGIEDTIVFMGSARTPSPEEVAAAGGDAGGLGRYYEAARELSRRLTLWAARQETGHRFVVCSGGGPGIMEAANRGAAEAGGESIGFGIELPFEQAMNSYATSELAFVFHYFFMRKFWFVYHAKAFVFFPGGFGTMDELFEVLTLVQTGKVDLQVGIVLFGSDYWRSVVNFEAMVEHGVIAPEDVRLFHITDDVDEAERQLQSFLTLRYGPTLLIDPIGS
jgi:uncharacterized protein (TIGR00730 family)